MSYRVEITKPAEEDARVAVDWIAQYSKEKAVLWYFDFLEVADSLQEFPARCPIAPESTEARELRHLLFGKYRLIFLIDDESVFILHVRHQKQRPLSPDEV
ncbi:MAG: type II toxin-antitoxin system RelE/ParE family toxin [Acidobacteriota bacterium]